MDKWSTREYKVNVALAGATLLAGIICLLSAGADGVVPEYSACLKNGGRMLIALAVVWFGLSASRWAITN